MTTSTINVLMTGAGAPGAPGIIKCLEQDAAINLLVADANLSCVGRHISPAFVQIPKGTDHDFIDKVLYVCKKKNITVLMPLVTRELLPLAKAKETFKDQGVHVLVSSENAIYIANNKASTYEFLQSTGIPVPEFYIANSIEEFKRAARNIGYPNNSFCFKPSEANGSRGFRIISNEVDEWDLLFNHKPNNAVISFEDAIRILSLRPFPELLVTELLPGDEYSVDCLAYEGEARLIIPRKRIKMINGISVQGAFVHDEEIIEYCRRIIKAIGLHGNIGIQVKRNKEGKALLLEINPRVQGTIVAALGAGVNLPLLALRQELGIPIHPSELNINWGTQFFRYWTETFYQ